MRTPGGQTKRLDELRLGERIAAMDQSTGDLVYSEVIAFIDRQPDERRQFVKLRTKSGQLLTLTATHLVPVQGRSVVYASRVQVGERVLVRHELNDDILGNEIARTQEAESRSLRWDEVAEVTLVLEDGVYAPLTREGTLLVNDVVASCYAVVDSQTIAHYSFMPLRLWSSIESTLSRVAGLLKSLGSTSSRTTTTTRTEPPTTLGMHWYAKFLCSIASYVLPKDMIYD